MPKTPRSESAPLAIGGRPANPPGKDFAILGAPGVPATLDASAPAECRRLCYTRRGLAAKIASVHKVPTLQTSRNETRTPGTKPARHYAPVMLGARDPAHGVRARRLGSLRAEERLPRRLMVVFWALIATRARDFEIPALTPLLHSRSLYLNDEANLNVLDARFAVEQTRLFERDRANSKRVTVENMKGKPPVASSADAVRAPVEKPLESQL